jgi:hypothetical protein
MVFRVFTCLSILDFSTLEKNKKRTEKSICTSFFSISNLSEHFRSFFFWQTSKRDCEKINQLKFSLFSSLTTEFSFFFDATTIIKTQHFCFQKISFSFQTKQVGRSVKMLQSVKWKNKIWIFCKMHFHIFTLHLKCKVCF